MSSALYLTSLFLNYAGELGHARAYTSASFNRTLCARRPVFVLDVPELLGTVNLIALPGFLAVTSSRRQPAKFLLDRPPGP